MSINKYEMTCMTEALPVTVFTPDTLKEQLLRQFPEEEVDDFIARLTREDKATFFFNGHEVHLKKITYH